jgi:hypothetical protein
MNEAASRLTKYKIVWIEYLSISQKQFSFWLSVAYLTVVLIILPIFLEYIETRRGFLLEDPLLNLFSPIDLTWFTFLLIYVSLAAAVINFSVTPRLFHTAILTYSIVVTFRIIAMYMLPLNPPQNIILLNDPFVQLFGTGEILTKDLFFSGHTSTLFMLYLIAENKFYKKLFLISTVVVALSVIIQHVHYTIDVFAAPFFTYTAYKITGKFLGLTSYTKNSA